MKILAVQLDIPNDEALAHEERVEIVASRVVAILDTHVRAPTLTVLPELTTVVYSDACFRHLDKFAEAAESYSFKVFKKIAQQHGVAISFSLPTVENGKYFITNIVVNAAGDVLSRYHKVHLAQLGASHEKQFFSPGEAFGAFELDGFKFGVILCYDFRFADYVRTLCVNYDIDVLLHPVAFTRDETFVSWHHFAITRALENQVYFLSINRAGAAWGHSILCSPWIDREDQPIKLGCEEQTCLVDIDREVLREVRKQIPLKMDRLSDYNALM